MIKRRRHIIAWLAVLLWMGIIFYLSHQPATKSSELSSGIVDFVVQTLDKLIPIKALDLELFHHMIRKGAHFTAYFILGMLVMFAMEKSTRHSYKSIILTLVICVGYAISDEVHQLFIPGRSGEVRDVLIDGSGATVGIGFYLLARKVFKSIKFNY